jgi:hypothetical protein
VGDDVAFPALGQSNSVVSCVGLFSVWFSGFMICSFFVFQILRGDTRPFWRVLATINLSLCWKKRNPDDTSFVGSGVYVDSLSFK